MNEDTVLKQLHPLYAEWEREDNCISDREYKEEQERSWYE